MKGKDEIKNLFSEKLGGYEVKVNPQLWVNVASQIGAGSAVAATGMALITKFVIGLGAASIITITALVVLDTKEETKKKIAVIEQNIKTKTIKKNGSERISVETTKIVANNDPVAPLDKEVTDLELPFTIQQDHLRLEDNPLTVIVEKQPMLGAPTGYSYPEVDVDPVQIKIEDLITENSFEIDIKFPNVFTPNRDGVNDVLFISNTEGLGEFEIVIRDENNNKVFQSTDLNFNWDGTNLGGEMVKQGNYIAFVTGKDTSGNVAKPKMYLFQVRK